MDDATIRERIIEAHAGSKTRFENAQKRLADDAAVGYQLSNRNAGEYIDAYERFGVFSTAESFLEQVDGLETLRRFVFERVTMHSDRGSGLDLAHRTAEHETYLMLMRMLSGKR